MDPPTVVKQCRKMLLVAMPLLFYQKYCLPFESLFGIQIQTKTINVITCLSLILRARTLIVLPDYKAL